ADGFAVSATLVGLWILTRIKERECDPECVLSADLYLKKAQRYYFRTRLGPPNWWPFSFPVWNSRLPVLVTARSSIDSLNFATVRGSVAARQKPRHVPLFPLGLLLLYSCRRCVGALLAQSRTIANRPMTADQAATLKRLAEAAYELDAFKPNLT